jgi:hypothetical protein
MDKLDTRIQALMPRYGTNEGHGHVWSRPDGMRARCGGSNMCSGCRADMTDLRAARDRVAQ